ncbi:reverse transcriptase domain-containing protein [Tanacetum coccineum]
MPPKMRTQSVGRPATKSLRGGTGVRVGRGRRGRRPREGTDERVDDLNGQGNEQGIGANGGVEGVNGNVNGTNGAAPDFSTIITQQLQNLLPAMLAQVDNQENVRNQNGCSYKEFLACNPKEYDGKRGDVVLTRWIEKMEFVQDMSGCSVDQNMKYTAGSFMGKALTWWNSQIRTLSQEVDVIVELRHGRGCHAAYTDRFHELARLVPHLVTPESRKIERYRYIKNSQKDGQARTQESEEYKKKPKNQSGSQKSQASVKSRLSFVNCGNVVCWNAVKHKEDDVGLNIFRQMCSENPLPNRFTFPSVFGACAKREKLEIRKGVHGLVVEYGEQEDLVVGTTIIDFYAECGEVDEALKKFSRMFVRNVVS